MFYAQFIDWKKEPQGIGRLEKVPYLYEVADCQICAVHFPIGEKWCKCNKKSKYKNMKVLVNGIKFDSLSEARRYSKLAQLEQMKIITDLEIQPKFVFAYNGQRMATYKADFRFQYKGRTYVEDVKGTKTAVFNLKRRMLAAYYPSVELFLIKP